VVIPRGKKKFCIMRGVADTFGIPWLLCCIERTKKMAARRLGRAHRQKSSSCIDGTSIPGPNPALNSQLYCITA
jgi:hypothetical protein